MNTPVRERAVEPVERPQASRSGLMAILPTACAVHCILTPLVVGLLPILQFGETIEPGLMAISLAIGTVEARSGSRIHGVRAVWALVLLGAVVWSASLMGLFEPVLPEPLTSATGGLLIAGALFWNGRLRHRRECATECSCPAPH